MSRKVRRASEGSIHTPPTEIWRVSETGYVALTVLKDGEGCTVCGRQIRIHPHYKGYEQAPFTVYKACDGSGVRIEQ